MSNTIIELRHSYVTGNVPSSLANGEIAINTYDGKLFYRGGASNTIQTIERFTGPAGLNQEVQFNDSGVLGSSANLTFAKTTGLLRTGNVTANTVTTRDYIQFGDGTRQFTANAGSANSFGRIFTSNNSVFANATSSTDQVTFTGFNGIEVKANSSTKTITFEATPGLQGLSVDYGLIVDSVISSLDYGTL